MASTEEIIVPNCQGCSSPIEEGAVVAFGESLFHVKCFNCAKCKECVDNKTNLLLLDDGRPVCDNCSYNCTACNKVIKDEAIMTGEKAYHSDCFQCVACKKVIDDLIFTQTTKGIYCTTCHDLRKAEKARKKLNKQTSPEQQKLQSKPDDITSTLSTPALPTPARSRSNSLKNSAGLTINDPPKHNESFLSELSPFTLSFFDSDSNELANLSNSLGANLSIESNINKPMNSTQTRINRVSEILQSSLRTSSLKQSEFSNSNELNTLDTNKLKQELTETRLRLKELETDYTSLQDASQQALDEFNKMKEDYAKDALIQQKQELVIVSLLKKNGGILARKEIERVAQLKLDLERSCKEMIHYRDKIMASIGKLGEKHEMSTYYSSHQKSLAIQIKSLTSEKDLLQHQTKVLEATRDEVVREMVLLNTKNAELTTMNNDLSRRAIEKEELVIIPTIHRHTPPPLSPSQSTETSTPPPRPRRPSDASSIMCKVSSRNSFISDQTPTLFRIKKKGSTMFNKLSGGGGSSTSTKPNKPEPSVSTSSTSTHGSSSKSSLYMNTSFNSSLQSLHLDIGKALVKNKSFLDSSASLQLTGSQHSGGNSHSFQPTSFIRPVKCGACGDKIWGRSEYRCDGCGFSSHSRCLSKVPQHCTTASHSNVDLTPSDSSSTFNLPLNSYDKPLPAPKKSVSDNSMFGSDLTERVAIENQSVPIIVQECIKAVESRGLDYEGIYRKSGGAAQIRAIQLSFDQGEKINLCDEDEYNDVCAITSVLKQYFRELPNPLLTFELYDTFINISSMNPDENKTKAFIEALGKLPKAHLSTIQLLFEHLGRVHEQSEENRMTVKNLAMVFAPTLMRHSDPSRDFLDISYKNATIEYILLHTSELFTS